MGLATSITLIIWQYDYGWCFLRTYFLFHIMAGLSGAVGESLVLHSGQLNFSFPLQLQTVQVLVQPPVLLLPHFHTSIASHFHTQKLEHSVTLNSPGSLNMTTHTARTRPTTLQLPLLLPFSNALQPLLFSNAFQLLPFSNAFQLLPFSNAFQLLLRSFITPYLTLNPVKAG